MDEEYKGKRRPTEREILKEVQAYRREGRAAHGSRVVARERSAAEIISEMNLPISDWKTIERDHAHTKR